MDLKEVVARLEIQQVLFRYARGVDRADFLTAISAYHPDATDAHPQMTGPAFEVVGDFVSRGETIAQVGSHHITNMIIEMDGDADAKVESYFLSFHPHRDGELVKQGIVAGRYLDHFQCRDGAWRIASRQIVMDWTRDDFDGARWPSVDGRPVQGQRRVNNDVSYSFFARPDAAAAKP